MDPRRWGAGYPRSFLNTMRTETSFRGAGNGQIEAGCPEGQSGV